MADEVEKPKPSSWSKLKHPIITGLITTVVGGLILARILVALGGEGANPVGGSGTDSSPDDVMEEVAARPFWTTAPRLYRDADGQRQYDVDSQTADGTVSQGDVVAVTPRELIEQGAKYEAKTVYLVGKVTAQEDLNTKHGLTSEYHLRGKEPGFDAYIAQDDMRIARAPTGAVVYALGRLAAAGETTDARGRKIKSAYFFCFRFCDFETITEFPPGSDAIRNAAHGLHAARSASDMLDAP